MPLLSSEYDWAESDWESYKEDYQVNSAAEFFVMLYAKDQDYSADDKDRDTILNDIADQYGTDYKALAAAYGDEAYFDEDVTNLATEYLVEQKTCCRRRRRSY